MSKFFIVYGHYNDSSFNAAIRDTFIEGAKKAGHQVDPVSYTHLTLPTNREV